MTALHPVSRPATEMMDWLLAEPADDCLEDLEALRRHLELISDPSIPVIDRCGCLDLADGRLLDITGRFKPHLLGAAFPLPREVQKAAGDIVDALLDVAERFLGLISAGVWKHLRIAEHPQRALAARGMRMVFDAFQILCMSGAGVPHSFWRLTYLLLAECGRPASIVDVIGGTAAGEEGVVLFKALVAVHTLQPESFTGRELAWIFEYVLPHAADVEISGSRMNPESAMTWFEISREDSPVAQVRREAPAGADVLFLRALGLARCAGEQIGRLEERIAQAESEGRSCDGELLESELPLGLSPVEVLSLLRRMRDRWTIPPSREHPRRRQIYAVQVCHGLRPMWELRHGAGKTPRITRWRVFSESPGGYAIISVSGETGSLVAGMAIGLRRDPDQPWSVCIVRWIRNERPDEVELGLQVVATSYEAVSVGFRDCGAEGTTPALLLPPLPSMRRNPAILAPAGTYGSRRFMIVRDGEPIYVAQARVLSLDVQTSSIELFQYEIDPYPG